MYVNYDLRYSNIQKIHFSRFILHTYAKHFLYFQKMNLQ